MKDIMGTRAISGVDRGKAAHLIDDSSLIESNNGWTDKAGEWSVAPGNTRQYAGYSDIEDLCAGVIDGVEVLAWLDDDKLYIDGVEKGTVTDATQIVAVADAFLIVGGSKNYVYDVNGFREHGTWQADRIAYGTSKPGCGVEVVQTNSTSKDITRCVGDGLFVYIDIDDTTSYTAGDILLIEDAPNLSAINNKHLTVNGVISSTRLALDDQSHIWATNPSTIYGSVSVPLIALSITDITTNAQATVTVSSGSLSTGDTIYISDVAGMTEINGSTYRILRAISSTEYIINVDTTEYGAYTSGGKAVASSCGYGGANYKFYMVPAIELADGTILEGRPRGLKEGYMNPAEPDDDSSWEADSIYISSGAQVSIQINIGWTDSGLVDPLFEIAGTANTDYWRIIRLYRTKADGTDIYLEEEFHSRTIEGPRCGGPGTEGEMRAEYYSSIGGAVYIYQSITPDKELGSVYLYSLTANENPGASTTACRFNDQIFTVSADNLHELHWTNPSDPSFSDPLNFIYILDHITAIRQFRNEMIIFSPRRIWAMQMIEGFPALRTIETTVGSTYPKAMEEVPGALLFLREDGMWAFDGIKTYNTSHSTFSGTDTPVALTASGDLVVAQWESTGLLGKDTADGVVWHDTDVTSAIVTDSGGSLYYADSDMIYSMFDGPRGAATLVSKAFGTGDEKRIVRILLDVTGRDIQEVWIDGARQDDTLLHDVVGDYSDRRIVRISVPRLSNPYCVVSVKIGGDAIVHGIMFETER